MDVGVTIPHTGRYASPEWVREYCTVAEQVGFDSLWAVDHLVMPHHTDSEYTLGRKPAKIANKFPRDFNRTMRTGIVTLCRARVVGRQIEQLRQIAELAFPVIQLIGFSGSRQLRNG